MTKKNMLLELINDQSWKDISSLYEPSEIVKNLGFKDCLRVAYHLLYNDSWDEDLQMFAVMLLEETRRAYSKEWKDSWEYDALLGLACDITSKHEERYEAYKRAFDRVDKPPPRLLIELARCCVCPGDPPISYDRAIELVTIALKEAQYADGISLLCNIYSLKNDEIKQKYWSDVLRNLNTEGKKINSPLIDPKFLVEEYVQEKRKSQRDE